MHPLGLGAGACLVSPHHIPQPCLFCQYLLRAPDVPLPHLCNVLLAFARLNFHPELSDKFFSLVRGCVPTQGGGTGYQGQVPGVGDSPSVCNGWCPLLVLLILQVPVVLLSLLASVWAAAPCVPSVTVIGFCLEHLQARRLHRWLTDVLLSPILLLFPLSPMGEVTG